MKFEVIGPDGQCKMSTIYEEYIPYSYMKQMSENGYKFRLDGKIISLAAAMNRRLPQIQCVETGEIFQKQSDAAKAYSIDPAQVSDSLKTGKKRSGYTFVRI
jgi:hypothetical protein